VGNVRATLTRELFCKKYGLAQGNAIITILPAAGAERLPTTFRSWWKRSRKFAKSYRAFPEIVVAVAPELDASQLEARFPSGWQVRFLKDDTYNALAAADLAIVSSGTATVETALLDKPMIVVYRLSPLTARLGNRW